MMELVFVVAFSTWYILSLILSENYGKEIKPGTEWLFFISMVFSPFIAALVVIVLKKKSLQN